MTDFLDAQSLRDWHARNDYQVGDACRRWSTCNSCATTSPELEFLCDQDAWEMDHDAPPNLGGCETPRAPRVYDEVLGVWPFPALLEFTRRLEPAGDTAPAPRSYHPTPWVKRDTRPVIYTDPKRDAA